MRALTADGQGVKRLFVIREKHPVVSIFGGNRGAGRQRLQGYCARDLRRNAALGPAARLNQQDDDNDQ